jgi:hypothetical protein
MSLKTRLQSICICCGFIITIGANAQIKTASDLVDTATGLTGNEGAGIKQMINNKIDSLKENPEFYNKIWNFLVGRLGEDDEKLAAWLNDLNLDFKTFQNEDSSKASLGVSYDFKIERGSIREDGNIRNAWSGGLQLNGNIAFKKEVNPYNFLNSKLALSYFRTGGGVFGTPGENEKEFQNRLQQLRIAMARKTSPQEILDSPEWQEFNRAIVIKSSWIFMPTLTAGLESNQDFSKTQFAAGIRAGTTIKAWDDDSRLSKLNVFDWPFALIRKLSGFDKKKGLHPLGAAIPTISIGFDYVDPGKDTVREKIDSKLSAYPRANAEASFRTIFAKAFKQTLYFNAAFRYYGELGASDKIKSNGLSRFTYFTTSITSSSGFYVAYTKGKLPFDRSTEGIYQLGFTYNFQSKDK